MDKAHAWTDRQIARIQKRIDRIYNKAEADLSKAARDFVKAMRPKADKLLQDVDQAENADDKRKAVNKYTVFWAVEARKNKAYDAFREAIAERMYEANQEAAVYINTQTPAIYQENYNKLGEGLQQQLNGYELKPASLDDVEQFAEIEKQTINKATDEKWNRGNVVTSVLAGAVTLLAVDKIASHVVRQVTSRNKGSAYRQASDMCTGAENQGRMDGMWRAYDEGFEVKKEWVAILDNRTRDTHRIYDGIGPVDLDYEYNDGLKEPRDPHCSIPEEVCNCRCMLAPDTGNQQSRTRAAREGTVTGRVTERESFYGTRTVSVPDMTYAEWMAWRSR